jgi:hypothetical protein
MGTKFSSGVPPGEPGDVLFNWNDQWGSSSRFKYDREKNTISISGFDIDDIDSVDLRRLMLGEDVVENLVIDNNEITIKQSVHTVDVESGTSDELNIINGGTLGQVLFLSSISIEKTIILKNGTGNIITPGLLDYSLLSNTFSILHLQSRIDGDGGNWYIVGGSSGNVVGDIDGGVF